MAKKTPAKKKPAKKTPAKKKTTKEAEPPVEEAPPSGKIVHKRIKANFWRTRLHGEELGIYQSLKYQAKTRYFAKNFDIEGVIEVDNEKKYIIAFNKDVWEESPKGQPRRLILRLFTIMEEGMGPGKGGNYKGGLELSITHSLIQSYEVKRPAAVFFIQMPKLAELVRVVSSWRFVGTRWVWPLLPEQKEDQLQMTVAKGVVGPGNNYEIYMGKKKIARIDAQPIQKEYEIEIWDEAYAKDKSFLMILTLFGCICNFMKDVRKMIKKMYKKMKKNGTTDYKPAKSEMDLFKNPRMMRK